MNILGRLMMVSALAAVVTLTPCAVFASPWNLADDFSKGNTPESAWSYGSTNTLYSTFNKFSGTAWDHENAGLKIWSSAPEVLPFVAYNPTDKPITVYNTVYMPSLAVLMHPGAAGQYAVVNWTAPAVGDYSINAVFSPLDVHGTSTDVHIFSGSTPYFNGIVHDIYGTAKVSDSQFVKYMTAGQVLSFAVGMDNKGNNEDYYWDSTRLDLKITSVAPEASSLAMLLPGLLPLGIVLKRRKK